MAIEPAHVVVSAVRPAVDALELRIYEAEGRPAAAEVELPSGVMGVAETNLLGNPLGPLPMKNGRLRLSLRPFEIKTLRLRNMRCKR